MTLSSDNLWIAYHSPRPGASWRLFCFPYSGGGALAYRLLGREVSEAIEVCPVQFPGREGRMREARFTRLADLVPAAVDALLPWMDRPFCLFGHSLGGLAAFEIARELRRRGAPQPRHLFVSGRSAPHRGVLYPLHQLPDAQLLEEIRRLDPPQPEALRNTELMQFMLPLLRADLAMCDTYAYTSEPPLALPITAFGGREDHLAMPESVQAWQSETTAAFRCHLFPGRHFFLHSSKPLFLDRLRDELDAVTRLLQKPGGT